MAIRIVDAAFVADRIGEVPIIDVRRPDEFLAGHIPSALNATVTPHAQDPGHARFIAAVEGLVPERAQPIVVYCRTGVRSAAAAKILEEAGYGSIFDYRGSWVDWTSDPSRPVSL